jgi:CspA family cold shock protein
MSTGTVKFFNENKGFGFITQDDSGDDLFVHISAIQSGELRENDKVEYEVGEGQKGPCAVNVNKL